MTVALKDIKSPFPKQNCWEFLKCGREPGGENIDTLGICPATTDTSADGSNGGKKGGRICWAISGTYCHKKMQGLFAKTQLSCRSCIFFKKVKEEEGIEHYHLEKAPDSLTIRVTQYHYGSNRTGGRNPYGFQKEPSG